MGSRRPWYRHAPCQRSQNRCDLMFLPRLGDPTPRLGDLELQNDEFNRKGLTKFEHIFFSLFFFLKTIHFLRFLVLARGGGPPSKPGLKVLKPRLRGFIDPEVLLI